MSWTEVVILVDEFPDEKLLLDGVRPLVEELRSELEAWHFFWEPDLFLRLRWSDPERRTDHEALIAERLDAARAGGLLSEWSFGQYEGDAAMMGEEMWALCERDFTNSAELALAIVGRERDGTLTHKRGFHWARHVHTFSNPLVGTWAEEARLSLLQARYRIRLARQGKGNEALAPRLGELVQKVDEAIAGIEVVAEAENQLVGRWRDEGRPDIRTLLDLPDDFHGDPGID